MKKEIARQIPEFSPKKKLRAFPHLQSQSLLEMWIKIRIICPKKYSKPKISAKISQTLNQGLNKLLKHLLF